MGSIARIWLAAEGRRGLQHGLAVWRISKFEDGELGREIPFVAGRNDDNLACRARIYCDQVRRLHDLSLVCGVQTLSGLQSLGPRIGCLRINLEFVAIDPVARATADG